MADIFKETMREFRDSLTNSQIEIQRQQQQFLINIVQRMAERGRSMPVVDGRESAEVRVLEDGSRSRDHYREHPPRPTVPSMAPASLMVE